MKLSKLAKLATVSAFALGAAYQVGVTPAMALPYDMGTTVQVPVNANVDNTVDLTSTAADTGAIGVTGSLLDTATITMDPTTGAIVDDVAGAAHLVSNTGTGTPAKIVVTAAFPTQNLYVSYSNPTNLVCGIGGGCSGNEPALTLDDVTDNLAIPGSSTGPTQGIEATSNLGALTWNIGITISTVNSANLYETGTYSGTFDMIVTY